MANPHHDECAAIEMNAIGRELIEIWPFLSKKKRAKLLKQSEEALEYARKVGFLPPKKKEMAEADEKLARSS